MEKTEWGSMVMTFLGLLLDTDRELICIPLDKLKKAIDMVEYFLNKRNKKCTLLELQRLCGFLNFLCKCIVPGRAFLRHLYSSIPAGLCAYHHLSISAENRMDLLIWKKFLAQPDVFYRPFADFKCLSAVDIDMYSDALRNFRKGFRAYCGSEWTCGVWEEQFMRQKQPSIEYLELFGVTVAVLNWIKFFKNKKVVLFVDNTSTRDMINASSSSFRNCMVLIRLIVLEGLTHNVQVTAKYVSSKDNGKADALSRLQFNRFHRLGKGKMSLQPTNIPEQIWPLQKIWLD